MEINQFRSEKFSLLLAKHCSIQLWAILVQYDRFYLGNVNLHAAMWLTWCYSLSLQTMSFQKQRKHLAQHNEPKVFMCPEEGCGKTYPTRKQRKSHVRLQHNAVWKSYFSHNNYYIVLWISHNNNFGFRIFPISHSVKIQCLCFVLFISNVYIALSQKLIRTRIVFLDAMCIHNYLSLF